jgi:hypothetical protein
MRDIALDALISKASFRRACTVWERETLSARGYGCSPNPFYGLPAAPHRTRIRRAPNQRPRKKQAARMVPAAMHRITGKSVMQRPCAKQTQRHEAGERRRQHDRRIAAQVCWARCAGQLSRRSDGDSWNADVSKTFAASRNIAFDRTVRSRDIKNTPAPRHGASVCAATGHGLNMRVECAGQRGGNKADPSEGTRIARRPRVYRVAGSPSGVASRRHCCPLHTPFTYASW